MKFHVLQTIGELGLKSKYLCSEYKKPLCVELEDVKIIQVSGDDLEKKLEKSKHDAMCEKLPKDARYLQGMKEISSNIFNYAMQFLPPTVMIVLKVRKLFLVVMCLVI